MAQDNQSGLPPLFDFDPPASKQQALCDLMRNAIVESVQPDKDVCEEDTFQDYHSPMVCRALAGIIAEFLSWLALSRQKGEDPDEFYEEFLDQLRVYWKDPDLSLPTEH
jgi:hypothetical protein